MRVRKDVDQKRLSELYHQYLNVEEDFVRDLFLGTETRPGRAYVHEPVLSRDNLSVTLDFEKASHIVEEAEHMAVGLCYCRHKTAHLGKACDAPLDICMTFGDCADSLIRHGHARRVDRVEGMELLAQAWEANLVQFGENVREQPSFICNCCGCCCEGMLAAKRFAMLHPVQTTAFLPKVDAEACNGCGKCAKVCAVDAIKLADRKAVVDEEVCLGCAVCARNCPKQAISLERRKEEIITPVNSAHRIVLQAIEKGMLPNLVFDNGAFASHRAMAALLGAILKLPPLKRAMASKQMKSVYLERLLR
jgi:ferredoxin